MITACTVGCTACSESGCSTCAESYYKTATSPANCKGKTRHIWLMLCEDFKLKYPKTFLGEFLTNGVYFALYAI